MSDYTIDWESLDNKSRKWLRKQGVLDKSLAQKLDEQTCQIAADPRGGSNRHLRAQWDCYWRRRWGANRLVYDINDPDGVVHMCRIGRRPGIYD